MSMDTDVTPNIFAHLAASVAFSVLTTVEVELVYDGFYFPLHITERTIASMIQI